MQQSFISIIICCSKNHKKRFCSVCEVSLKRFDLIHDEVQSLNSARPSSNKASIFKIHPKVV